MQGDIAMRRDGWWKFRGAEVNGWMNDERSRLTHHGLDDPEQVRRPFTFMVKGVGCSTRRHGRP